MKDPKFFEQKFKTVDRNFSTYTPHTAWVQKFGKQPRLLRTSGVAFVPNSMFYGPCRRSRLSDYVAYKSARRSGPCLRFLGFVGFVYGFVETVVTKKLTRTEQAKLLEQCSKQNSPTKRRGKLMGKRTGGRPCNKLEE